MSVIKRKPDRLLCQEQAQPRIDHSALFRQKPTMPMSSPSIPQLQRAIQIQEQIHKLEGELRSIFDGRGTGSGITAPAAKAPKATGGKRFVSPEARAKMAAAQKARWAKP